MSANELRDVQDKVTEALRAAEADTGAADVTVSSVQAAHLAICMLKAGLAESVA